MIDAVIVAVPVHDEEALLPACLLALESAAHALPPSIRCVAIVVLDACADRSAAIAASWARGRVDRHVLEVGHRNVGRARAAGIDAALAAVAMDPARVWLATTDADSAVLPDWLTGQLALAANGIEAIAGAIRVTDWEDYAPELAARFQTFYDPPGADDTHAHVHGANLGIRADAYLAAGGFPPLATGEDHALWNALVATSRRFISSRRIAVVTSARRHARAPAGFGGYLTAMERAA